MKTEGVRKSLASTSDLSRPMRGGNCVGHQKTAWSSSITAKQKHVTDTLALLNVECSSLTTSQRQPSLSHS